MALSSEGLKITNVSLTVHKSIVGHPQFYVRVSLSGKKDIDAITAKKRLTGDRVCWPDASESLSLPVTGNAIDGLLIVFDVVETHRLYRRTVASFRKKVEDLVQSQEQSGSCKLEAKTCQLTFNLEQVTNVLPAVMEQTSNSVTKVPSLEIPAKIAGIISSAEHVFAKQEGTWSSFLSQFQVFMGAMDTVAELHPYAKFAWSILSLIPKAIISQHQRNDSVQKLYEKLDSVYNYITDAERLPKLTATQTKALSVLLQQTIECAYFIRDYGAGNPVWHVLKGITIDDKSQEFNEKLDHIMKVLTDSITLEVSIVSLRIAETTSNIEDLTLLSELPYARDAGFVSGKRCLPGTRQKLINEILEWVYNDTSRRIFLLSGQAGTGKSAVAHTIAEIFEDQNRLGSLFCFNRSYKDRCNLLFSTISRNLADGDVLWRKGLVKAIQKTSTRTSTDPVKQFEELISNPSKEVTTAGPVVIIIDALDESGDRRERGPILDLLFKRCTQLPSNYRIIITSRPEQDIELYTDPVTIFCKRMGDIMPDETLSDIQSYISSRLDPIASVLNKIDKDWPGILAKHTEGLFQWAETACRFIDPTVSYPPTVQKRWNTCVSGSSSSLHAFYQHIILSQPECEDSQFVEDFKTIIGVIMVAREPFSIDELQNILQGIIPDIRIILVPFGSLFVGVNDTFTVIQPLHTSLFDYFNYQDNNRFYIDTSDHTVLTLGCLKLMNRMLCFNICQLETSHKRNVPDFLPRVKEFIPTHLSYACRVWSFHLWRSKLGDGLIAEIYVLMHKNLLFFLEALSLLGQVEQGRVAMKILEIWCKDADNDLADKAVDTWLFISDFEEPIMASAPHLYISALPFTPSDSFVSKQYLSLYPQLLSIEVDQVTPSTSVVKSRLIKKNTSPPAKIVFSPQGNYIASGFDCGELWIWDYRTGEMVYQLDSKHRETPSWICDIVFSPNAEVVYYCFKNGIIWIWDSKTNDAVRESYPLKVFEDGSYMCTISSDGCYFAFQSRTGRISIHDRKAGLEIKQFDANYDGQSMFCPNGNLFAFVVSSRNDIGLWNTRTRTLVTCPLNPNSNCTIKSFSDNHLVFTLGLVLEILDVQKMTRVSWNMKHSITSATLFPDGERLLSVCCGMSDLVNFVSTYTIWNINTEEKIFEACTGERIGLLAVSHDSQFISFTTMSDDVAVIHVGRVDKPPLHISPTQRDIDSLDSKLTSQFVLEVWLRKSRLIRFYICQERYHLQISDTVTNKTIMEGGDLEWFPVAVLDNLRDQHASVAYVANGGRSLCVWSETNGQCITEDYANDRITSLSFSAAGDRLVFGDTDGVVRMLDIRDLAHPPICETICTVSDAIESLAISTTGISFLVAYQFGKQLSVEVRECGLGSPTATFSEPLEGGLHTVAFSANETFILCISYKDIAIWSIATGEKRRFVNIYYPQLSSDRRFIAFQSADGFTLWDIENEVALDHPSSDRSISFKLAFKFSDDSTRIVTVENDKESLARVFIWDLYIRKCTVDLLPRSLIFGYKVDLYGDYLFLAADENGQNSHLCIIENLDVLDIMRPLYEHHQNNSRFGMCPVDHPDPGTTQPIKTFNESNESPSGDVEVLNYALSAWHKALFTASSEITHQGWMLGPHGELLFWVPEKKRNSLWYPCMTYTTSKTVTKLNFENFVHGSQWTECRANR